MARPRTCARSASPDTTDSGSMPVMWFGSQVAELPEPEIRQGGQHLALAGDRVVEHDVERRQPIGLHHQQLVLAHGVDVAHLAAVQECAGS